MASSHTQAFQILDVIPGTSKSCYHIAIFKVIERKATKYIYGGLIMCATFVVHIQLLEVAIGPEKVVPSLLFSLVVLPLSVSLYQNI